MKSPKNIGIDELGNQNLSLDSFPFRELHNEKKASIKFSNSNAFFEIERPTNRNISGDSNQIRLLLSATKFEWHHAPRRPEDVEWPKPQISSPTIPQKKGQARPSFLDFGRCAPEFAVAFGAGGVVEPFTLRS
jgi:hypothetical protein